MQLFTVLPAHIESALRASIQRFGVLVPVVRDYACDDTATMIDLDGLEYCRRCREPLALIEVARDIGQAVKPVTVLRRLAVRAGIRAVCVLYVPSAEPCPCGPLGTDVECCHGILTMRARQVHPTNDDTWLEMDPTRFAGWLYFIRSVSACASRRAAAAS